MGFGSVGLLNTAKYNDLKRRFRTQQVNLKEFHFLRGSECAFLHKNTKPRWQDDLSEGRHARP